MRVLHVCDQFVTGGIETLVADVCRCLESTIETRIIALYDTENRNDVSVRIPQIINVQMVRKYRLEPQGLFRLWRAVKNIRPQIVHCHGYYSAFAMLMLRSVGVRLPLVYTVHADIFRAVQRSDFVINAAANRCDYVVAVSESTARSVEEFTGGTVHPRVILNGIDVSRMGTVSPELRGRTRIQLNIDDSSTVIISVAALNQQKDHPTLMRAFATYIKHTPNADLVFVGDGPRQMELKALAQSLLISKQTHFLGKREDIGDLLCAADVFALSTHNEGLPISVIEALCLGLPVVASAVGGLRDLPKLGLPISLCLPQQPEPFAACMLCFSDPEHRQAVGRKLRQRAREVFRVEDTARQYFQLYSHHVPRAA